MKKIIIVDDDELSNMITSKLINMFDNSAEIVSFTNPIKALKHIIENIDEPDAILLDINMPMINGFEFIEQLLENDNKEIINKIAAFSSSDYDPDIQRMRDLGVEKFLMKPICDKQYAKISNTKAV